MILHANHHDRWNQRRRVRNDQLAKMPVVRLRIQCNLRQLNDFPIEGPDKWMYYVYGKYRPVKWTSHMPDEYHDRFSYMASMYPGPLASGRNMAQALCVYKRKMEALKKGRDTFYGISEL